MRAGISGVLGHPYARARKLGRPEKLNASVAEKIVQLFKVGNTNEAAAINAGIGLSTFYRWMELGEKKGKRFAAFREFREAVTRAKAEFEGQCVAVIRTAAVNDWKAALALLERRNPEQWGRATRVAGPVKVEAELTADADIAHKHVVDIPTDIPEVAGAMTALAVAIYNASPMGRGELRPGAPDRATA